jgi:hypothetical protein
LVYDMSMSNLLSYSSDCTNIKLLTETVLWSRPEKVRRGSFEHHFSQAMQAGRKAYTPSSVS